MKISICTLTARRGFADIQARMIAAQDYPKEDLEWVLIDFAFEERAKLMRDLSDELSLKIRHYRNIRDGSWFFRDITRNRNLALNQATGDAVIFVDDYAMITPQFVKEHVEVLKKNQLSAGRMFRLEVDAGEIGRFPDYQDEQPIYYYTDPAQILGKFNKNIGKDYRDKGDANIYKATGISYTGNLGIPRIIFEHLNGFDPRMESGLEDCDFGLRTTLAGFETYYNPKAYTINLDYNSGQVPYTYSFDHPHDVEPFISNPNNNFAGDDKLKENAFMKVIFHEHYRIAVCKICGARGMIDPNEIMNAKAAANEFQTPTGMPGGFR